jgi:hypothetical protein
MEVPDAYQAINWIGVDRGQNNIAVAALPHKFGKFWKGGKVKNLRRRYQQIRSALQKAKQLKEVLRLEQQKGVLNSVFRHV